MSSPTPNLSIVIPATPKRMQSHLIPLFESLTKQVDALANPNDVEVLVFLDNKKRSIGYKRDTLVQMARGEYVIFTDDDDHVSDTYVQEFNTAIINNRGVDVITFNQWCVINDNPKLPVRFKLGHPVNEPVVAPNGATRPPWHVCAWKTEIAKRFHFPDSMYGEDWAWAVQCNAVAKTSFHIDKFLQAYIYNDKVTEAV